MQLSTGKALSSVRERKHLEFKQAFDPDQGSDWCELIKDLVAIANSGGGILIFGLDNFGQPVTSDLSKVIALDPADTANRLRQYIGKEDIDIEVELPNKNGRPLVLWRIGAALIPITFEKPGTYPVAAGKQRTSFSEGTTYFRHSAKSEPGNTNDLRLSINRYVEGLRKGWLSGVKQVVSAPIGSTFSISHPSNFGSYDGTFRAVSDPNAPQVHLTRDPAVATGKFVHEQVSDALFSGINSVIDANRLLFRDQNCFLLGSQAYYRIYAERDLISQAEEEFERLLDFAVTDYSPALFWFKKLSSDTVASRLVRIYLAPKGNEIHTLTRIAPLLGVDFCLWMSERFQSKWRKYSQPPNFYHSFVKMVNSDLKSDPRVLASRLAPTGVTDLPDGKRVSTTHLLKTSNETTQHLSHACKEVFDGRKEHRNLCRALDYIAYGAEIVDRSTEIASLIIEKVGRQLPDTK